MRPVFSIFSIFLAPLLDFSNCSFNDLISEIFLKLLYFYLSQIWRCVKKLKIGQSFGILLSFLSDSENCGRLWKKTSRSLAILNLGVRPVGSSICLPKASIKAWLLLELVWDFFSKEYFWRLFKEVFIHPSKCPKCFLAINDHNWMKMRVSVGTSSLLLMWPYAHFDHFQAAMSPFEGPCAL